MAEYLDEFLKKMDEGKPAEDRGEDPSRRRRKTASFSTA